MLKFLNNFLKGIEPTPPCTTHIAFRGYKVRGTVRSQERAERIKQKYSQYQSQLEVVVVEDISQPGALDDATKGVQYVHHVASPFHFALVDPYVQSANATMILTLLSKKDFLDPAINGTLNALKAAQKAGTVRRVIITSSLAAMLDLFTVS